MEQVTFRGTNDLVWDEGTFHGMREPCMGQGNLLWGRGTFCGMGGFILQKHKVKYFVQYVMTIK